MTDASDAERKADGERQNQLEQAKPKIGILQYMVATQVWRTGFTITLLDGTSYTAEGGDNAFTDGISIIHEGDRMFFPMTAIMSIRARTPK